MGSSGRPRPRRRGHAQPVPRAARARRARGRAAGRDRQADGADGRGRPAARDRGGRTRPAPHGLPEPPMGRGLPDGPPAALRGRARPDRPVRVAVRAVASRGPPGGVARTRRPRGGRRAPVRPRGPSDRSGGRSVRPAPHRLRRGRPPAARRRDRRRRLRGARARRGCPQPPVDERPRGDPGTADAGARAARGVREVRAGRPGAGAERGGAPGRPGLGPRAARAVGAPVHRGRRTHRRDGAGRLRGVLPRGRGVAPRGRAASGGSERLGHGARDHRGRPGERPHPTA